MNQSPTAPSPGAPTTAALPALPALVDGYVAHTRRTPMRHAFRYRVYQWLVDVDDLPESPWYLRPFTGFRAADHLGEPHRTLRDNVERLLALDGIELSQGSRIVMLANARVFGHVFDPLTVFWCFDGSGDLACVVAEVHNTYAERHVYLLRPDVDGLARADKAFYVSPFNDLSGSYELRFGLTTDTVATSITLVRGGSPAFAATFRGTPRRATNRAVATEVLRRPLMPQRVTALIRLHGIALWLRRLPVVPRPTHHHQEGV